MITARIEGEGTDVPIEGINSSIEHIMCICSRLQQYSSKYFPLGSEKHLQSNQFYDYLRKNRTEVQKPIDAKYSLEVMKDSIKLTQNFKTSFVTIRSF